MLSVPGVIAYERPQKEDNFFSRVIMNHLSKFASFLHVLNLERNVKKADTPSDQTSDDDSDKEVKITGGKLVKKVVGDR